MAKSHRKHPTPGADAERESLPSGPLNPATPARRIRGAVRAWLETARAGRRLTSSEVSAGAGESPSPEVPGTGSAWSGTPGAREPGVWRRGVGRGRILWQVRGRRLAEATGAQEGPAPRPGSAAGVAVSVGRCAFADPGVSSSGVGPGASAGTFVRSWAGDVGRAARGAGSHARVSRKGADRPRTPCFSFPTCQTACPLKVRFQSKLLRKVQDFGE